MSPPAAAARDRLRIAIQKSGRLSEPARALLASCGLGWRESRDRLFCYGESLPIDLLLVRDDDIPGLLADGVCDLGIVGRNVLLEQAGERAASGAQASFREWRALGFGACRLALAVPEEWTWDGAAQLDGKRVATSYPALLSQWLRGAGRECRGGDAVGFGRNRAATGQGRCDLRPGVQRRHPGGQPSQASGNIAGERSRAGRSGRSVC